MTDYSSYTTTIRNMFLSTDEFAGGNYEGIKTMHIADFLLSKEF